ncbi:hypothetical protein O0I10_010015 [Lichtheimia ornata]|uniref:BRCT domain-containing protein n=1 Tax=Lichtheimia ornata TaxID=688661 RepID=A0AAD7XRQ4_9FUNG|nr:uncharacterized protein O0I10_010015 [Lichtheimia ornata]KAJ8654319.1 hypothetical protein O0I10_010015 [Lichtheimia ornata]
MRHNSASVCEGKGYKHLKERIQDLVNAAGATVESNLPTENPTSDTNVDDTLQEPRKSVKVCFTNTSPDMKDDILKRASANGLHIVVHEKVMKDTIHIVSMVDAEGIASRTESHVLEITLSKHVVSTQWLEESITQKTFTKENNFMVTGDHIAGATGAPQRALEMKGKLLEGLGIILSLERMNEDNYEPGLYVSDILPCHGSNWPCVIRAVIFQEQGIPGRCSYGIEGEGYKSLKEKLQDLCNAAGGTVERNLPKTQNKTSDSNFDEKQVTTLSEPVFLIPTTELRNTL